MSFGDYGNLPPRPPIVGATGSVATFSWSQQLSLEMTSFQKQCAILKDRIVELRRRKATIAEKSDLDREVGKLRNQESKIGQQLDQQRKLMDAKPPNGIDRANFNKFSKDFDRMKLSLQALTNEMQLVKVAKNDEEVHGTMDSFSRVAGDNKRQAGSGYSSATQNQPFDQYDQDRNNGINGNNRNSNMPVLMQISEIKAIDIEEELILERERDIKKLNHDLMLVNDMFKEMADIVDKQGKSIDTIHASTEASHQKAQAGLDQVKQAATYQPGCTIV